MRETKILVALDDAENKIVNYYKTTHSLITKEEAIKRIVRQWGKAYLLPEIKKELER